MNAFAPGFGSMFEMDHSTVNAGRDKDSLDEDKYTLYHDRHLFQVYGVLDLLAGPASNWMIHEGMGRQAFDLARAAMAQWLNEVRETTKKFTAEQMASMELDPYTDMGNPVLWAGVLCHKVIRDGDQWERYHAGQQSGDWTMKAVHRLCKRNQHHRFVDVRRDGIKTYHTLRLSKSVGKRKDRRAKAEKLNQLLVNAGRDALPDCVLNMEPPDDVERPPAGFIDSMAVDLWRRWKDRRESEYKDKKRHAELYWAAEQAAEKATKEACTLRYKQQYAHVSQSDSDFTDDEDYHDEIPPGDSGALPPSNAHPPVTAPPASTQIGRSASASGEHVHRAESDELILVAPPSANTRTPETTPYDGAYDGYDDCESDDVVRINPNGIDPEQMERDQNRIERKRMGMNLLRQPDECDDSDGEWEHDAMFDSKRACAMFGGVN